MPLLIKSPFILLSATETKYLIRDGLSEGGGGIDDRFLHDVAGELVVGEVDEIGADVG
jgi:hypothetical protein